MAAPVLIEPIPPQVVNELAAFGPMDLKRFIQVPADSPEVVFTAELKDGRALPKGLICTADGILTGIPAKDTKGNYEILIKAQNPEGAVETTLVFAIKPVLTTESGFIDKL